MRAALIPPKGYFNTARRSDIHLVLAQIQDHSYEDVNASLPKDDYIIVDNGAAEGAMVSDLTLVRQARYYRADEVVIPDVLRDASATVERCKHFMERYAPRIPDANLMGVVQSTGTVAEVIQCLKAFEKFDRITTVGIPRHMMQSDIWKRQRVCDWIRQDGLQDRFQVHLLGTNPKFVDEPFYIARVNGWVRSVDSSLPYNYTIAKKALEPTSQLIVRPEGYFTRDWQLNDELLNSNIATFIGWASGTKGPRG